MDYIKVKATAHISDFPGSFKKNRKQLNKGRPV